MFRPTSEQQTQGSQQQQPYQPFATQQPVAQPLAQRTIFEDPIPDFKFAEVQMGFKDKSHAYIKNNGKKPNWKHFRHTRQPLCIALEECLDSCTSGWELVMYVAVFGFNMKHDGSLKYRTLDALRGLAEHLTQLQAEQQAQPQGDQNIMQRAGQGIANIFQKVKAYAVGEDIFKPDEKYKQLKKELEDPLAKVAEQLAPKFPKLNSLCVFSSADKKTSLNGVQAHDALVTLQKLILWADDRLTSKRNQYAAKPVCKKYQRKLKERVEHTHDIMKLLGRTVLGRATADDYQAAHREYDWFCSNHKKSDVKKILKEFFDKHYRSDDFQALAESNRPEL